LNEHPTRNIDNIDINKITLPLIKSLLVIYFKFYHNYKVFKIFYIYYKKFVSKTKNKQICYERYNKPKINLEIHILANLLIINFNI
ncbi:hypothetical protein ERM39_12035, partial [Clostridioides difficile]|nr:hypothetical protein [Clostridioides difficile]